MFINKCTAPTYLSYEKQYKINHYNYFYQLATLTILIGGFLFFASLFVAIIQCRVKK